MKNELENLADSEEATLPEICERLPDELSSILDYIG